MRTIWKYELSLENVQAVELPQLSVILAVQVQNNKICMWVQHSQTAETYKQTVCIVGTGQRIHGGVSKYIDTVQLDGFVWHVYV